MNLKKHGRVGRNPPPGCGSAIEFGLNIFNPDKDITVYSFHSSVGQNPCSPRRSCGPDNWCSFDTDKIVMVSGVEPCSKAARMKRPSTPATTRDLVRSG